MKHLIVSGFPWFDSSFYYQNNVVWSECRKKSSIH